MTGGERRRRGREVQRAVLRQQLRRGPAAGDQGLEHAVGQQARPRDGQRAAQGAAAGVARAGGEHGGDAEPELAVVGRPGQRGQRRVRGRVGQRADGGGDPAVLLVDVREAPPAAARALAYPSSHAVGEVRCQSTSRECHGADRSDPVGADPGPGRSRSITGPLERLGWCACSGGFTGSRPSSVSPAPSTASGDSRPTRWPATCSAGSCRGGGRPTSSCATARASTSTSARTRSTPPRSATRSPSWSPTTRRGSGSSRTCCSTPSAAWPTRASAATSSCSRTTPTPRATPTAATRTTSSAVRGSSPASPTCCCRSS